ncbi:MAG: hypothetical protein KGJ11_01940 [Candidatus Omnitrophica bacterium]|nr:hypothetical protein [Candidatus Omnitrophota bacterium]
MIGGENEGVKGTSLPGAGKKGTSAKTGPVIKVLTENAKITNQTRGVLLAFIIPSHLSS